MKTSEERAADRAARIINGQCVRCSKKVEPERRAVGKKNCWRCADAASASSSLYYKAKILPGELERHKNGQCIRCGVNIGSGWRCENCRAINRKYELKATLKIQAERKKKGFCPRCGKRKTPTGTACKYCRESMKKYYRNKP